VIQNLEIRGIPRQNIDQRTLAQCLQGLGGSRVA
jgi:hypothetical protein